MTEIYIVIKVGFEGIDDLGRAFLDKDKAIEYYNQQRAQYDNPSKDDDEMSYYFYLLENPDITTDENPAQKWLEREKRSFCIQKDSGEGFECVCRELGVSHDELWLY